MAKLNGETEVLFARWRPRYRRMLNRLMDANHRTNLGSELEVLVEAAYAARFGRKNGSAARFDDSTDLESCKELVPVSPLRAG